MTEGLFAPQPLEPSVRVCVLQAVLPAYRTPVFNALGRRDGIDLTVWAGSAAYGAKTDDPERFESFSFRDAPVRHVGPLLWQPAQLESLRAGFDVVVFSWSTRYVQLGPSLALARRAGVRSVVWGHGESTADSPLRRRVRDGVSALADAVLVYNHRVAAEMRRRSSNPTKVFVALNAIDQTGIQAAREWWAARPQELDQFRSEKDVAGRRLFVSLSRLRPDKKTGLLLRVFARLVSEGRDVRLVVIGDGTERARLEADARRLGIADRVRFLGTLYDERQIAAWCLSAVACVVPASIGLSLLHAFGYGLPVLTTDEDQTPEIEALEHGVNGLLVRPGDPEALLDAMRDLLDDDPRQQALSRGASATVTQGEFRLDGMVDGMVEAIQFAARARRTS